MFSLISRTQFPERGIVALRYGHECGLEVLSLESDDPENLFAICFPTAPSDDTGVAHIIEHSVLSGSKRYPVRDPFVCMLKSSMATFINAMTYPDRTVYPCTTCCRKDYFNLFDVYWDAVFHPELKRETFLREGWHYELGGSSRRPKLEINGIVYNEMSGYYSDPGTVLERAVSRTLLNDSRMRYDSGGFPGRIPSLSYRKFRQFHREHYNPAVTKVVLYGNIPTAEKLEYIERQLADTPAYPVAPQGALPKSARVRLPASRRVPFVPDPASRAGGTGIAAVAWRLDEATRSADDLGLQLLESVLMGGSGAPLNKALMDSGLGSAVLGSGYDNETQFATFAVGMRGVKPCNVHRFHRLVMETLRKCVSEGLDPQMVQAAVSAFRLENQVTDSKHLLDLLEDVMASWCYSDDPFFFMRQAEELPKIREVLARRPRYFEELIDRYLVSNPRRVLIGMTPDSGLQKRMQQAQRKRLESRLRGMDQARRDRVRRDMAMLESSAGQPDSAEALASLPRLHRSDLPAVAPPVPYEDALLPGGLPVRRGRLFHNGVCQLVAIGDMAQLPPQLHLAMPLFLSLFTLLGNGKYSYDAFSRLLNSLGVAFSVNSGYNSLKNGDPALELKLMCGGLEENFPQALELLRLQLDSIIFSERARLAQCLKAAAARAAAAIVTRAALPRCQARCSAGLFPNGELQESVAGFSGYHLCQELAKYDGARLDALVEDLQKCAEWLRGMPMVAAGYLGGDGGLAAAGQFLQGFGRRDALTGFASPVHLDRPLTPPAMRREFCPVDTKVSCCTRVLRADGLSPRQRAAAKVLCRILSEGFLWDQIRVKGGAYMVQASYSRHLQRLSLCSADDPHPENAYAAFDAILEQLHSPGMLSADAVEQSLISCAGAYLRPVYQAEMAGLCAKMLAHRRSNESRQRRYEMLQALDAGDLMAIGDQLFDPARNCHNDCAIVPAQVKMAGFEKIIL